MKNLIAPGLFSNARALGYGVGKQASAVRLKWTSNFHRELQLVPFSVLQGRCPFPNSANHREPNGMHSAANSSYIELRTHCRLGVEATVPPQECCLSHR